MMQQMPSAVSAHWYHSLKIETTLLQFQSTTSRTIKDNDAADAISCLSTLVPQSKDRNNFATIPVHHIKSEIPLTGSNLKL